MTSGTLAFSTPAPPRAAFISRFVEFMVVGGATLVLFPLGWLLRRVVGDHSTEFAVGFFTFYGAYVINDPHFAVTYFLFYKQARARALNRQQPWTQRLRYWIAGLFVPAALTIWGVSAIVARSAQAIGWMVQLMFLLVGWHYVKQGFGVLAVLCARRDFQLTSRERSVVLGHCFAAWAYAWANPATQAGEFEEKGVVYAALGHPRLLELTSGCALAVSGVVLVVTFFARWRREKVTPPLAPLAGFLITVWSWTIYSSVDRFIQYLIPALHSVQYLYFVWLMKRNESRAAEGPPTFGRPPAVRIAFLAASALALGFILFHGAPSLLDDIFVPRHKRGGMTDALGPTPFFATFFVIVNIHHYFMDHVVWRRENPDTRFLREI